MRKIIVLSILLLLSILTSAYGHGHRESGPGVVVTSAIKSEVKPHQPIPEISPITNTQFKSWSIFLITNPIWVTSNAKELIDNLYDAYSAFGQAIGPNHSAIWLWKDAEIVSGSRGNVIDVDRAATIIEILNEGLRPDERVSPSQGPFLYVTVMYPGRCLLEEYPSSFAPKSKNGYLLALGDIAAQDITTHLTELADQLVLHGVPNSDVASEPYWRAWQNALQTVGDKLGNLLKHISIALKTPFFNLTYNGE